MYYSSYGPWRGCKDVYMGYFNDYADPDLVWNGYAFNYWDIEDAMWQMFLEDTGYKDSDSDNPFVERKFDKYVQDFTVDYLKECIFGGYFSRGQTSWHERYDTKEKNEKEAA